MYVSKLYKPAELSDVKSKLKSVLDIWINKHVEAEHDKSLEDWIIIALHQQGYRIVKTRK